MYTEARKVLSRLLEFNPNLRPTPRRVLETNWFTDAIGNQDKQRLARVCIVREHLCYLHIKDTYENLVPPSDFDVWD